MPVLDDEEETTTTTDETTDDEDSLQVKPNKRSSYNVKIRGGGGHYAIGNKAKVVYKPENKIMLNESKVLADFDAFLQNIANSRGPEKDRIECFAVTKLLAHIEHHALETASNSIDTLEMLARLGSPCLKSPRLAKYAFKLLDKLVFIDIGKDITNAHIVLTEKHLRSSFVNGSFREELLYDLRRRLEVYFHVLTALLIARANEKIPYPYKETDQDDIVTCKASIEKLLKSWPCPSKDRKRFSSEMILQLLERLMSKKRLLKPFSRLLIMCNEMLEGFTDETVDSFLREVDHMGDHGHVDLLIVIKMLHAKAFYHPMAYMLFKSIISKHHLFSPHWKQNREKKDWHLALLTCQILVDITLNHHSKETRIDAARFLVDSRLKKVAQKSPLIYNIISDHIDKALFAFDVESRRIFLENRYKDNNQEQLPSTTLCKRLCSVNQSGSMEVSETLSENNSHVIMRGRYDGKPVTVKAACVIPVTRLFTAHDQETTPEEIKMQNEISISRYLNSESNEHVPKCYAADINQLPCHWVMEHAQNGDLRNYLLKRRERNAPSYREVLEICYACAKAMEYLHKKKVIHNQLNAGHVLVCQTSQSIKVTGFGRAKHVASDNEFNHGYKGNRLDDTDDIIRWTDPEGLHDQPLFSSKSDVWAFGCLMFEIITCGDVPYADKDLQTVRKDVLAGRFLAKHTNMKDGYYDLVQRCFRRDISFKQICSKLQNLIDSCNKTDNRPMKMTELKKPTAAEHVENAFYPDDYTRTTIYNECEKKKFVIKQAILDENSECHAVNLRALDNPFLVKVFSYKKREDVTVISHEHYTGQRLSGDLLKKNNYSVDDLTRFCAQICSAVDYLHSKGIVHCSLTLDNVILVTDTQVKLGGLQHTRSLHFCQNENIPISTALRIKVPQHLHRWHAPEVIQDDVYSKEGAIWSLGMLMWTLLNSIEPDVQCHQPLYQYKDHEILQKLKYGLRPFQTSNCPDWLYIVMTQCWLHRTSERASSLSIVECLTNRIPWESCILQNWLTKHCEEDVCENWPNLNIFLRSASEFISPPTREAVMESMTEECLDEHSYDYQQPTWNLKKAFKKTVMSVFRKRFLLSRSQPPIPSSTIMPASNQLLLSSTRVPTLSRKSPRPLPDLPSVYNHPEGLYDEPDECRKKYQNDVCMYECMYDTDLTEKHNSETLHTREVENYDDVCSATETPCFNKEEEEESYAEVDSSEPRETETCPRDDDQFDAYQEIYEDFSHTSNANIKDENEESSYEDPAILKACSQEMFNEIDDNKQNEEQEINEGNEEKRMDNEEEENKAYQSVSFMHENKDDFSGYLPFYQTPPSQNTMTNVEYCDVAILPPRPEYSGRRHSVS